ncbi:proline-rich transmembrane protein 1-like isoform X1 [Mytilus galloprovincialis]|uniref:proline-rich transmembrane protein 1-like isoform X1 n=1 Tax=Mytilus galloprovincialis TaxID=29158 RepID=UPI003F7B978B
MSYEKRGYPDQEYPPQEAPPTYNQSTPQYSWHGQSYAPQKPQDHPGFPPAPGTGYQTQYNVVAPGMVTMAEPPPPDYMTRAIMVTVCCFWPIGIFAIMKASESKSAYARGDLAGAKENSRSAKQLSNIGIAAGVVSVVILVIIMGVYFGLIFSSSRFG